MRKGSFSYSHLLCLLLAALWACASGCGSGGGSYLQSTAGFSGDVAVSSATLNVVSLFDSAGNFIKNLRDLNLPSSDTPYGLMPGTQPGQILVAVNSVGHVEALSYGNATYSTPFLSPNLNNSLPTGLASDGSGNILVTTNGSFTVEKFTPSGFRIGAPFIPLTVGLCSISVPYGIAVAANGVIAVANSGASSVNLYNPDGTCLARLNGAPFNANQPRVIAYDAVHGKFVVAFFASGAVYSFNPDGSSPVLAYLNTTYVINPTALTVDSAGNLYVGSQTLNTVEKLSFDGTTATRVGVLPFIPANQYNRFPTGILVIP